MPQLEIPQAKYREFNEAIIAANQRLPYEGVFELTYRCNLNCGHCYCNSPSLKRKDDELKFSDICRLMDEIADEGCLWVAFTGGEPLMREDFFDIYMYAKKKGVITAILTNATLIDKDAADFLSDWPPYQLEVSLYGATEETYERVTRVKGSFKKCMEAIDLLRRRQIALEIKTVASAINKHEINKIHDFAHGLGAKFRYDPLIHCRYDGDKAPHSLRLVPEECVDLESELPDMSDYWQKLCKLYAAGTAIDSSKLYTCGAGQNSFAISPYGKLQACMFSGRYTYDLKGGSFNDGWYNFIPRVMERKRLRQDFACQNCRAQAFCGQCANWAYLENQDEEEIVSYICALYKERLKRFGPNDANRKESQNAEKKQIQKTRNNQD